MAFNDPNSLTKQALDDTLPLTCIMDTAQKSGDHIEYMLRVQRGRAPDQANCWQVTKRYSDFVALDSVLKDTNIELTLPPKKLLGNFDREFVSERQRGLQTYMDAVLSHPLLANSMPVKQFLDEKNYSPDIPKVANQHVSMAFRSQPGWVSEGVINSLGWRIRKNFFPVKQLNGGKPHGSFLLEWIEYGPDRCIPDKEMSGLMSVLPNIAHPHIFPVTYATATEYGAIVIRPVAEKGSIRDFVCKCKPRGGPFLKKYGNLKTVSPFPIPTAKAFGRQILETLNFLKEKKFPYGHLHPGNVLVKDNGCLLSDIENSILGLPSLYRGFLLDFRKIQTTEMVDIYGFGHVMYTMVFGRELTTPTCDSFPPECPAQLRSVLESILTTEACKNGLPTIENLLSHPFFADAPPVAVTDRPQLKVPSKLKESVRQAREAVEGRLKDDQTLVYQIKRRSKAKQFHFSEEEKKKRQKSRKKATENGTSDSSSAPAASAPASPSQSSQASSSSSASQPAASSASPAPPPPPPPPPPPAAPAAPPPPPPAPAPPPPTAGGGSAPSNGSQTEGRTALLSSITGFKKGGLKKVTTVDKSKPKLG